MGKRIGLIAILLCLSAILWRQFGDKVVARINGSPVRLLSSSGPLELDTAAESQPQEFTHIFLRDRNMRVVIRAWFYNPGAMAQPYLAVDEQRRGVLHIETKGRLLSDRCVFLRQLEIEIPSERWRSLKSFSIDNHDSPPWKEAELVFSNPRDLQKLLQESQQKLALEDLPKISYDC